jgi:uncharacterized protein (TIGR00661 family)
MKILYGVQGTGNGHITRARTMARALAEAGIEVDWVFSGRPREKYFDMDVFGQFLTFRGMTFVIKRGQVQFPQTVMRNNIWQLYKDAKALDLTGYDLIFNDFEPVSAWAARLVGKRVIGISHQCAFHHEIPKRGNNPMVAWFMHNFAPVNLPIGLHWHHFGQPILPPLIEPSRYPNERQPRFYLIYLPFSELAEILPQLQAFPDCRFHMYHGIQEMREEANVKILPFSREGFQRDLHRCEGVMCNAGFELASEALQLGKKLLVQPVKGQMEQLSNALALTRLGYGTVTNHWDKSIIGEWIGLPDPAPVPYPDVARELVVWLKNGADNFEELRARLWKNMPEPCRQFPAAAQACDFC